MIDRIRKTFQNASAPAAAEKQVPANPEESVRHWQKTLESWQTLHLKIRNQLTQLQKKKEQHQAALSSVQLEIEKQLPAQNRAGTETLFMKKVTTLLKMEKAEQYHELLAEKEQALVWIIEKMALKLDEIQLILTVNQVADKAYLVHDMALLHQKYLQELDLLVGYDDFSFALDEIDETLQHLEIKKRVRAELEESKRKCQQLQLHKQQQEWEILQRRFSRYFNEINQEAASEQKPEPDLHAFFDPEPSPDLAGQKEEIMKRFFEQSIPDNWKDFFND